MSGQARQISAGDIGDGQVQPRHLAIVPNFSTTIPQYTTTVVDGWVVVASGTFGLSSVLNLLYEIASVGVKHTVSSATFDIELAIWDGPNVSGNGYAAVLFDHVRLGTAGDFLPMALVGALATDPSGTFGLAGFDTVNNHSWSLRVRNHTAGTLTVGYGNLYALGVYDAFRMVAIPWGG